MAQGYHEKITWIFLEVVHTRFQPDTALGLFRQAEAKTSHETLDEVVSVINNSTPKTNRNKAIAVPEDAF